MFALIMLQVLSLRKNDLQWLPPDAAKMKSMQQIIVTGLILCFCRHLNRNAAAHITRCCRKSFDIDTCCPRF